MENISKALYMAVGVLIAILILTVFIWVFRNGGQFLASFEENGDTQKIEEYNADLIIYKRDNNTIYDVITVCNIAYDINKQNDYDNVNYLEIEINIDGTNYKLENTNSLNSGIIKQGMADIPIISLVDKVILGNKLSAVIPGGATGQERQYVHTFTGEVEYDNQTGKINLITFELNKKNN